MPLKTLNAQFRVCRDANKLGALQRSARFSSIHSVYIYPYSQHYRATVLPNEIIRRKAFCDRARAHSSNSLAEQCRDGVCS